MLTRELTVPNYGWKVELFEPSMGEWATLSEAYNARKWDEVYKALAPLVKKWNCTDKAGPVLEKTPEGVSKLPMTVLKYIILTLDKELAEDSVPKNPSSS